MVEKIRNAAGFTLIELLIALTLVSVLAAIVIPVAFSSRERAFVSTMKHDLRLLATAQEAYFVDNQTYAPSLPAIGDGMKLSENVSMEIDSATATGWGATTTHAATPWTCNMAITQNVKGSPACSDGGGPVAGGGS